MDILDELKDMYDDGSILDCYMLRNILREKGCEDKVDKYAEQLKDSGRELVE